MTDRISWYRSNAEKCLSLAHRFRDPESKRSLLAMANAWLAMAEQSSSSETTPVSDRPQPRTPIPGEPEAG